MQESILENTGLILDLTKIVIDYCRLTKDERYLITYTKKIFFNRRMIRHYEMEIYHYSYQWSEMPCKRVREQRVKFINLCHRINSHKLNIRHFEDAVESLKKMGICLW